MKANKREKGLLTENEFFNATNLDEKTRERYEKSGYLTPPQVSEGIKYYSEESVAIVQAMAKCLARCSDLDEAYRIAVLGMASKKRRIEEADSTGIKTIDPRDIKTHPRFAGLFSIDEDLAESLSTDMAVEGYFPSIPVVLGIWPGQEEQVLVDGHTRVGAAIGSGVEKIPYVVETFDDENGALEYIAQVQTQRRPTNDWVRYQLIEELDSLMERGGDRRSDQAKSEPPRGGLEKPKQSSAERTAALVGTSPRTVERARRIRKDGWPSLMDALKNGEMTISQAEKAIIKRAAAGNKTAEESPVPEEEPQVEENKKPMVHLTDANFEVLEQLDETVHYHTNKAVRMYIRWCRRTGKLPEKDQPGDEADLEVS